MYYNIRSEKTQLKRPKFSEKVKNRTKYTKSCKIKVSILIRESNLVLRKLCLKRN